MFLCPHYWLSPLSPGWCISGSCWSIRSATPLASLATWLLCLPSLVLTCYSSEYPLLLFLLVFGEKELVRCTFVPGYILSISKRNMALKIGDLGCGGWEDGWPLSDFVLAKRKECLDNTELRVSNHWLCFLRIYILMENSNNKNKHSNDYSQLPVTPSPQQNHFPFPCVCCFPQHPLYLRGLMFKESRSWQTMSYGPNWPAFNFYKIKHFSWNTHLFTHCLWLFLQWNRVE